MLLYLCMVMQGERHREWGNEKNEWQTVRVKKE